METRAWAQRPGPHRDCTFLLGGGGKLGRGETREASKRTTLRGGAGFQSPTCAEQSEGLSALVPAIKLIQEIVVVIPKGGGEADGAEVTSPLINVIVSAD